MNDREFVDLLMAIYAAAYAVGAGIDRETNEGAAADRILGAMLAYARRGQESEHLRAALSRWGRWCHSGDGIGSDLFHDAVEGTPDDCFPGGDAPDESTPSPATPA